jgi:hypothetical protein
MLRFVAWSVLCACLGGCASAALDEPVKPEKQYRTGSNIPRREGSVPDSVETSTVSTGDTRLGVPGVPRPMGGGR